MVPTLDLLRGPTRRLRFQHAFWLRTAAAYRARARDPGYGLPRAAALRLHAHAMGMARTVRAEIERRDARELALPALARAA